MITIKTVRKILGSNRKNLSDEEIQEIVKFLRVSRMTVHKWKEQGKIPFRRISSRIFFKRSEVLESLVTIKH